MKKLTAKKGVECMACLECVRACSTAFYKEFDPAKACLQIVDRKGAAKPMLCVQCGKCAEACPNGAITLTDAEKEAQTNAADVVKGNIVIYGKLTPKTYAVNYDANANGDTTVSGIPDAQTKTHGVALPLTVTNPTRDGHTFKGWATSADGPVAYQPGGQYLNDAPVTLYAVWEKLTYTVTISSGAGYSTVPAGVATVNWHDPFTFAKQGYVLDKNRLINGQPSLFSVCRAELPDP